MTMSALIATTLIEAVAGLTARERLGAMQKIDSGGGIMTSRWFTIIMAIVLAGSVIALAVVNMYKKARSRRTSSQAVNEPSKTVKTPARASMAGDSAGPDVKSGYNKPADAGAGSPRFAGETSKGSFIALFPFVRNLDSDSTGQRVLQFSPAIIAAVTGRVVYVETLLPANVGDRVIVVLESRGNGEGAQTGELIEDMGIVQQSAQPAEIIKEPNGRRLAVALTGLTEAQAAQLAGITLAAKSGASTKNDKSASPEVKVAAEPPGTKEQGK